MYQNIKSFLQTIIKMEERYQKANSLGNIQFYDNVSSADVVDQASSYTDKSVK